MPFLQKYLLTGQNARGPQGRLGQVMAEFGKAGEDTRWGLESCLHVVTCSLPQSLSSTVTLEHSPLPPGVHISYESQCGGPEEREREAGDRGQCNEVRINQTVRASRDRQKEGSGGAGWEIEAGRKRWGADTEQCKSVG